MPSKGGRHADPDRGGGMPRGKDTLLLDQQEHANRQDEREGLRDLNRLVENNPSLNRLQKDRERISPRSTAADVRDERMRRTLPTAGTKRSPISARQRNDRSKTRRAVAERLPNTQLMAQQRLTTRVEHWSVINNDLSDAIGDIQALPDKEQEQIRRVDRSIQAYEQHNERGHVLYTVARMPPAINASNFEGFVRNQSTPGRTVSFDRFTMATHQMHESVQRTGIQDGSNRHVVFEMETRRGAYLGQSDKTDNTAHVLPRGMDFEVVSVQDVSYTRPDGSSGRQKVVQLRDVTPD